MENESAKILEHDVEITLRNGGVPIRKLEDFTGDTTAHKEAMESTISFVKRDIRWLAFIGKTGTGKTHLACAIIRETMMTYRPFDFIYTKHIRMIRRIRSTYQSGAKENEYDVVKRFSSTKLLILDEVGLAGEVSSWERATLDDILDHRYEHQLPLILTSNLPAKQLFSMLGERIESRFIEMGRVVNCTWGDYRKQ